MSKVENLRSNPLIALAQDFSPRYELHHDNLISIDVRGLDRLLGAPRAVGEAIGRSAATRELHVQVAVAATPTAAMVLALARPGLTIVDRGGEADALAPIPIDILSKCQVSSLKSQVDDAEKLETSDFRLETFHQWGLKTLGDLARLPSAELAARLGSRGLAWQSIARGQDVRPLVPMRAEERFERQIDLEWPIEGLEPLSFVLTRLLEPLSTQLERQDRGAATLHVTLGLVKAYPPHPSDPPHPAHQTLLQLPWPMRDVRTLRTLILLDLESHPPPAPIERVTVLIEPTPGRVWQHMLFARAHPIPEQVSTLVARLVALMGQDRIGRPALVDSHRPGAFTMRSFEMEAGALLPSPERESPRSGAAPAALASAEGRVRRVGVGSGGGGVPAAEGEDGAPREVKKDVVSALRRCRSPVPARVATADGRPVHVTTDRREVAGGRVLMCAGPWRTSGGWWEQSSVDSRQSSVRGREPRTAAGPSTVDRRLSTRWSRDEWDVSLSDGAVYRIFQDRETHRWFIEAIVD